MTATTTERPSGATASDRTHYLYIAVIVAVVLGIAVGFVAPRLRASSSSRSAPASSTLIKMMIQPVIFCTIVLGVGSVRSAASVGKVGGLALLGYFTTMSTVALAHRPGRRQHHPPRRGARARPTRSPAGRPEQAAEAHGVDDRLPARASSPTRCFSSLTSGEVLQTLLVALLVGFALQAMGGAGKPVLRRRRSTSSGWSSGSWR